MPRRQSATAIAAPRAGAADYLKLEKRLLLLAWLNSLFGYKTNAEILTGIKQAGQGFDEGRDDGTGLQDAD